jgi:methyl-accepting chemotaxis protein
MSEVKHAIKQVSDIVGEIAAASEEQSRGIEQVHQAVSQMDEVTQQNAALVEQAAAGAQSLQEQATNLKHAVSVFKLTDASPSHSLAVVPESRPSVSARKAPVAHVKPRATIRSNTARTSADAAAATPTAKEAWETF